MLSGVSCAFGPGLHVVIGPNGAGKSTLLRLLAGLAVPTRGQVSLDGLPLIHQNHTWCARRIAYVPQRPVVSASFTVRQVVELGRYAIGPDPERIKEVLERLHLTEIAARKFNELSVGQQQRVSLARALAQLDHHGDRPRVLLADEPFSAMDPAHVLEMAGLVRAWTEADATAVLVLHDLTLVRRLADDVLLLNDQGHVRAFGPARSTLTSSMLTEVFQLSFHEIQAPGGPAIISELPTTRQGD